MALDGYQPDDIKAGVQLILSGKIAEHDGRYAPTAPQVARAVHKALEVRLDHERRANRPMLLEHQDVQKDLPESERAAFVKSQLARAGVMIPDKRTPDAIAAAKKLEAEIQVRHDARFIAR